MKTDLPVVESSTGTRHAVWASGSSTDGSLYMFATLCGLDAGKMLEIDEAEDVTCGNCARILQRLDTQEPHASEFPARLRSAVDALDWNMTADPGLVEHVKSILQDPENMSDWSKAIREIVIAELMLPAEEFDLAPSTRASYPIDAPDEETNP